MNSGDGVDQDPLDQIQQVRFKLDIAESIGDTSSKFVLDLLYLLIDSLKSSRL